MSWSAHDLSLNYRKPDTHPDPVRRDSHRRSFSSCMKRQDLRNITPGYTIDRSAEDQHEDEEKGNGR